MISLYVFLAVLPYRHLGTHALLEVQKNRKGTRIGYYNFCQTMPSQTQQLHIDSQWFTSYMYKTKQCTSQGAVIDAFGMLPGSPAEVCFRVCSPWPTNQHATVLTLQELIHWGPVCLIHCYDEVPAACHIQVVQSLIHSASLHHIAPAGAEEGIHLLC